MASISKNVSKFVLSFIAEHKAEDIESVWNSTKNQNALKKVLSNTGKKVKDPSAPKRSKSSYLFFCNEERLKIKKEKPDLSAKEITAELGVRWNALKKKGDKYVQKYEKMAQDDKARYEEEKTSYVPDPLYEAMSGKKAKDPSAPKRAKSSYLFFCESERKVLKKEQPDLSAKEITSELGNRWNALKDDKKRTKEYQKFVKLAEQDKVRYQNEKQGATSSSTEEVAEPKKASKKSAKKDSGEELSGYQLFCHEQRPVVKKSNKGMKAKEITKELSKMWKALSPEEQKKYD